MKIKWLVQTSGFDSSFLEEVIVTLDRLGYEYDTFGVIGKERMISNLNNILEPKTKYISIGGVLMSEILTESDSLKDCAPYIDDDKNNCTNMNFLKNSIDFNRNNFDQLVYKDLNLPLLNNEDNYYMCKNILDMKFE